MNKILNFDFDLILNKILNIFTGAYLGINCMIRYSMQAQQFSAHFRRSFIMVSGFQNIPCLPTGKLCSKALYIIDMFIKKSMS